MNSFEKRAKRPLHWIASSYDDLLDCPEPVQREIGRALTVAQYGGKHGSAKPWKGLGSGVLEIVENLDRNTYRAVYTVRFKEAVYVLHVFQKKSPSGVKTSRIDVQLIQSRLRLAQADYETNYGEKGC